VILALAAISVSRLTARSRLSVVMNETNETTQPEDRANDERTVLLLTMIDAARALSIGRTTMYELVAAGEIGVVHIGRSARVPVAALEEYVDRQRFGGTTVRSRNAARAKRELDPGQPTT
jgi:excisionase family DNA binding protein